MTHSAELPEDAARNLIQKLRQKEGNWLDWGRACGQLQQAGYKPQAIFEETGFEPIQQNQIIVACQVYETMAATELAAATQERFARSGSDILYELRILSQTQRAAAANLVAAKQLDALEAREAARAIREYNRLRDLPVGFGPEAGDAVAYRYWCLARGKKDLQARSQAIAQALKFASSDGARAQVEQLLRDFTVVPTQPVPIVPFYRLESDDQLPCLLPLLPSLQATAADLAACPSPEAAAENPFNILTLPPAASATAWAALPGWSSVRNAVSPVAIVCNSDAFPNADGVVESVLAVVDRGAADWTPRAYFAIEREGSLAFDWFASEPDAATPLLARVVFVLRSQKRLESGSVVGDTWDLNE